MPNNQGRMCVSNLRLRRASRAGSSIISFAERGDAVAFSMCATSSSTVKESLWSSIAFAIVNWQVSSAGKHKGVHSRDKRGTRRTARRHIFYRRIGYLYTSAMRPYLQSRSAASRPVLNAAKHSVEVWRGESGEDLRLELPCPVSRGLGSVTSQGIGEFGRGDRLSVAM